MQRNTAPSKENIALLEPLNRLGLESIVVVSTQAQAAHAFEVLDACSVLGFDTESKPTFVREEISSGPHVVQLSTLHKAYVFQLHDAGCCEIVAALLQGLHVSHAFSDQSVVGLAEPQEADEARGQESQMDREG